jgi:hypothetical protein
MNPIDWVYDLESYPNIFTASFKHPVSDTRLLFEISDRKSDLFELTEFLTALKYTNCRMIGFNNIGYDYPIIHLILEHCNYNSCITANDIYNKSKSIIDTPWNNRFSNIIPEWNVIIPQIDLLKIHHFDNKSRLTSLKMLEFNMCMDSIQDLPYKPGTILTNDEKDKLILYNDHDVDATTDFYIESLEMIGFREELSKKHDRNFLNHSDKKIGTDLFIAELERSNPGSCYGRDINNKKIKKQTIRESINIGEIIFPYIQFKELEFERIRKWMSEQVITETKGIFKDITATINDFTYNFGTGGMHASIDSTIVYSDDEYEIWDWDVGGYYPEVGTVNNLYPEHLSEHFCVVNEQLKQERKKYKKGTALNNSIKLSRNGAFGDSNNKYSPFLDSKYTMSITINGQLLLCMLAQYLTDIPNLTMIQANTDGLTVRCPRQYIEQMKSICKWWESYTCLELESAIYSRMFIRDVNNYIGEYKNGKLKSKGAYVHKTKQSQGNDWTPNDMDWHQNYSALIIPKAAEFALVHGQDIEDFIINHDNIFDFMLRTKINKSDNLMLGNVELQRVTRYYISKVGGSLIKVSPPAKGYKVGSWKRASGLTDEYYNAVIDELVAVENSHDLDINGIPWDARINTKNRSKYKIRETGINVGWLVSECNDIKKADKSNINFDYYINEAKKLVNPLRNRVDKSVNIT